MGQLMRFFPLWEQKDWLSVVYGPAHEILSPYAIFRLWHHFLFLDNIETNQEKFKLSFEYFWK